MANNILNKYIDAINNNKTTKGAYIYGDFGIGKTYHMKELLTATVKKTNFGNEHEIVVSTQTRGYLIVWPTIIDQLKQNMNAEKNGDLAPHQLRWNLWYDCQVLIIDDIGGEMPSDWALREKLFPLLNHRIEKRSTTFFTSNFSTKELANYYLKKCELVTVGRVMDRIRGLTDEIKMTGENLRRKAWIETETTSILEQE